MFFKKKKVYILVNFLNKYAFSQTEIISGQRNFSYVFFLFYTYKILIHILNFCIKYRSNKDYMRKVK